MPAESCHPLAHSRWGVALLASLAVFTPMAIDMYLPALPTIGRDLGTGDSQMQWTVSIFLLGSCVGMLAYGPISDSFGRRGVMLSGIAVFIAASLACAAAADAGTLIGLRFLQAAGGGGAAVMSRAIVRDIFPRAECARVLSLVALVTAITPMLAPLVGGQVLAAAGWRGIFLVLAAYGFVALALAWVRIPESHPAEHRAGLKLWAAVAVYAQLLRDRAAWGCVLCAGGTFAAMFVYIAGTPFVYIEHFGVSPQLYGVLFGLNIVSQMIGTYLNSRLLARHSLMTLSRWAAAVGLAGGTALLAAGLSGQGGLIAIVLPLLLVVGVSVLQASNMTARIIALYPDNAGAAAALTSAMFGLGAVSSLGVSLLNDGTPLAMGLIIFLCCALAAAGLSPLFAGRGTGRA